MAQNGQWTAVCNRRRRTWTRCPVILLSVSHATISIACLSVINYQTYLSIRRLTSVFSSYSSEEVFHHRIPLYIFSWYTSYWSNWIWWEGDTTYRATDAAFLLCCFRPCWQSAVPIWHHRILLLHMTWASPEQGSAALSFLHQTLLNSAKVERQWKVLLQRSHHRSLTRQWMRRHWNLQMKLMRNNSSKFFHLLNS